MAWYQTVTLLVRKRRRFISTYQTLNTCLRCTHPLNNTLYGWLDEWIVLSNVSSKVECRYNAAEYYIICHTALQWIKISWFTVKTNKNSYGVYTVSILEEIECIITTPQCNWQVLAVLEYLQAAVMTNSGSWMHKSPAPGWLTHISIWQIMQYLKC